ncbi:hypothetical protein BDW22DRAFT_1360088 [Trametopsis cervina]|nr:hypothetical protein BDW22DRAFT_1360088 [Trametopsis cervina]
MRSLSLLGCIISAAAGIRAFAALPQVLVQTISGQPNSGPAYAELISNASGFDGPKIHNLNNTSFDWWYFDVIADDFETSASFVFFTATPDGLFGGVPPLDTATWLLAVASFPNGSFTTILTADELVVTTAGDGSSGAFSGATASWTGAADMSTHTLLFNAPDSDLTGTVTMQSTAPAHFPCGPASEGAGQSLALGQYLGWFNAVPAASAHVDINVGGTQLTFSGHGYHDKNWGAVPTEETVRSWYWGHASLGPYSVVWFEHINLDGTEGTSGYLAENSTILSSSCAGVTVRPTGKGAVHPPTPATPLPSGFSVSLEVPGRGSFELSAKNINVIAQQDGVYTRWLGKLSGGFVDENESYEGIAHYEQFTF